MRGSIRTLSQRAAHAGTLAITGALAAGHLSLLLTQWSALRWSQVLLLALAVALCSALALLHRTLGGRPVLLLLFALLSIAAHPPGDLDGAASTSVLPVLALLAAMVSAQAPQSCHTVFVSAPVRVLIPVSRRHQRPRLVTVSLHSRPPPRGR